ncbi:LuxR C-terminal-related transcriptional regulator [Brachybacterium huguangmaarense]|uniref:LuxR C-terminal-related transcriptional regulator n=1 Tax=Brachybacterium huguangmaarense TaxID=1652028 RepID=A0ABY6G1K8_9MICO|nr:LuxR C-terminal-related transcriptional regulator [Brachybacterium huguangmaarense]UYG17092.1 LuxR C-terminal-related transcriptional regulator [Brachybacterium huguangmaarense]
MHGRSNEEICERLHLSINTVKTYIRAAYAKMSVTTRSQAVRWGLEHGLGGTATTEGRG